LAPFRATLKQFWNEEGFSTMIFMPRKRTGKMREPIVRAALEHMLAEAVRHDSECEAFVGVVVGRVVPARSGEVNWSVRGVRYGKADRDRCAAALSRHVAAAQQEYELAPQNQTSPKLSPA
jgi:hypothetical protein